jgi:UDP-N-acetylmuramate: L-alanyl-gamma-D-glutamyl-meso-diaminopimelate ligase
MFSFRFWKQTAILIIMNSSDSKGPKRLHITGICGVATSAIAIAFHKQGWKVTGSDKGFYPPVSTYLIEAGVPYYAGWHPEHMEAHGRPDFIMTGGVGTSPSNPELIYAKEHSIPVLTYAEVIRDYFIKKNSIVVTGTWGKTTTTSLLSFVLLEAGLDPSYFTGGLSLSHPTGALSNSDWSVVEGDEYQISISDRRPKFVHYSPTHLLLTSVSWDHADLYPTERDYFAAFEKLVTEVPASGKIIACTDDEGVKKVLNATKKFAGTYGTSEAADYRYHSVTHSRNGLDFIITHNGNNFQISTPMLGRFNAENITACFAMAYEIGIRAEKIISAIRQFKGIKRRFEKRYEGAVTVLDCHAPTAEKAASVLASVREVYDKKIVAIYEPNIGGRQRASVSSYDNAFKNADVVIIPRLTKLKVAENQPVTEQALEGDILAEIMKKTHSSVHYLESDEKVVSFAIEQARPGDVIVFLGSHGFRGMIEEVIKRFT